MHWDMKCALCICVYQYFVHFMMQFQFRLSMTAVDKDINFISVNFKTWTGYRGACCMTKLKPIEDQQYAKLY